MSLKVAAEDFPISIRAEGVSHVAVFSGCADQGDLDYFLANCRRPDDVITVKRLPKPVVLGATRAAHKVPTRDTVAVRRSVAQRR